MPISRGRFLLIALVVALLGGLAFTPGLPGDFVFDDHPNIVNNRSIQHDEPGLAGLYKAIATPQVSGNMRTLPTVTFAVDYWRGGGADPATFKTTNILIHAITALALAWLFHSLLLAGGVPASRAHWAGPALALAWALHPLQVSSVLYAVQRLQTMGTLFLVFALIAYMRARRAQVEAQPARTWWMLTALLWVLAMSCKEDSVLLPAYALALELTVLRFAAADTKTTRLLRRGYLAGVLAGAVLYLVWIIPNHWHWEAYGGRDFSTPERLLTQGRVLCLYLWQILLPLPGHMPFYYDWIQPSRSLLQPWTTLPALVLVLALLATAWWLRTRQPLLSLGLLLFFSAHVVTSNVIGLELAFEHRNHFALIGMVLAVGSLLALLWQRLRLSTSAGTTITVTLLAVLGSATLVRAHDWRSNLHLHEASTAAAPGSARAWVALCAERLSAGGGAVADNPLLDQAIAACEAGTVSAPYSLNNFALLIALKSLRGDVTARDWQRYRQQIETVQMSWDNRRSIQILIYRSRNGLTLDRQEMIATIASIAERAAFSPFENASLGYYVMNDLGKPDSALPYFARAIQESARIDPFPLHLAGELEALGRPDLAAAVTELAASRHEAPQSSGRAD
ncbi:hypothetical protein QFW80_12455 [Luteimonas sp. M1R5S18]|uniref:Tetratricopeptide repeat protein n=1 Tax=Luteimonas rhizosphaericola TaxID=3042024 RepID=A0ABT6JKY0_9GAMM|nr:hypothetical protein [Luteimonas rhizosphaericola]MDH5831326.1 hypothetical protein [Luteimonas rhizosphaericola]